MSVGGNGDDDDLEAKIEALIAEISQLTDIFRRSMQGREVEDEEDGEAIDKWDQGSQRNPADSIDEYRSIRSQAAKNDTIVQPYLRGDDLPEGIGYVDAYTRMFTRGIVNLEEMNAGLSDDAFKEVIQRYHILWSQVGGTNTIPPELVAVADPEPGLFGVTAVGGNIVINTISSVSTFIKAYGATWSESASPADELDLPPASFDFIGGQRTVKELNKQMASAAFNRNNVELPRRFADLLEGEEKRRFFENR